jgi:predicted nicotinamide N-methyase
MNQSPARSLSEGQLSTRTQTQLAELPIPGGWTWQTIELAGERWRLLLPADGDAFLSEAVDPHAWPDPYWTQIWPAARSLAELVVTHGFPETANVLELGCGNGFVSLAALARGCHLTFSDYVPLAVELAVANARGNGYERVCGEVLDWRNAVADTKYDVILAADVLYDPELHQPLLNTLRAKIAPGGLAWLGDPGRGECAETFVQRARQAGWNVTLFDSQREQCASLVRGEFRLIVLMP